MAVINKESCDTRKTNKDYEKVKAIWKCSTNMVKLRLASQSKNESSLISFNTVFM